jgi:hypothetical protein
MYGLDAVLVKNVNGKIVVTDENVMGYQPSSTDASQDIKVESTKVKNGVLQVKFSRAINTKDNQADIPLDGCKMWQVNTKIIFMYKITNNLTVYYQYQSLLGTYQQTHSDSNWQTSLFE